MKPYDSVTEELLEEVLVEEKETDTGDPSFLVVFNDDHNSFDHVIKSFVDVLEHSSTQAEQLSMMIHFKGKAIVKTAPMSILKPRKDALIERGLSAIIEGDSRN